MPATAVEIVVPTAFGLEAVVDRELQHLGYAERRVENGRITLPADLAAVCRLNLRLRSAERVLLKMGEFEARDFDALFEGTTQLAWSEWLPVDAAFPVTGKSTRSQLSHVPSCQSIIKKAVVENLRRTHGRSRFDETGAEMPIEFSIVKDRVLLSLNTSGAGLHKRGYRQRGGKAPLKETLAAGLVQLSFWNAERPFWDPVCGTGTIAIEAAMQARNIAPGLWRNFTAEAWPMLNEDLWQAARDEARDAQREGLPEKLIATDIDERAVRAARENAEQAGVGDDIHCQRRELSEVSSSRPFGCVVCNPPYGERMGADADIEPLYRTMADVFSRLPDWSFFVLTSYPKLEVLFGRTADRRRKLYNGRIACTYYQFHGPKPPSLRRGE